MIPTHTLSKRGLTIHGAAGAVLGLIVVLLILAVDLLGVGTMLLAAEHSSAHLVLLLIKPMMLFAVLGLAWSLLRQTSVRA